MKGSVRLRGEKWSYYFNYKDEYGKHRKKEKSGFATKKEANAALRQAIINWEDKEYIEKIVDYTLSEYISHWFESVGNFNLRPETITLYQSVVKNHINPSIGHLNLSKIKPTLLQSFFSSFQKKNGYSIVITAKKVLNHTFKLAKKQNLILHNPIDSIELAKKQEKSEKHRIISSDDLNLILAELDRSKYHVVFTIAIHTGMRRGEILGLLWDDIDFKNNTIIVNKQLQLQQPNRTLKLVPTKTKNSVRTLQMTKVLYEYLKAFKIESDKNKAFYGEYYYDQEYFVCRENNGDPINPTTLSARTTYLSKKLGINFSFHDLRHTHATMMLEADCNIKVLQQRLGHSKISTTLDTYSHLTKKLEDQSIERYDHFFAQKNATTSPTLVANVVANTKIKGGKEKSKENSRHIRIVKM